MMVSPKTFGRSDEDEDDKIYEMFKKNVRKKLSVSDKSRLMKKIPKNLE